MFSFSQLVRKVDPLNTPSVSVSQNVELKRIKRMELVFMQPDTGLEEAPQLSSPTEFFAHSHSAFRVPLLLGAAACTS